MPKSRDIAGLYVELDLQRIDEGGLIAQINEELNRVATGLLAHS